MPREIEAKIRVPSHQPRLERLARLDAVLVGDLLQRDTFFDRPDGSLRAADSALRLRSESDRQRGAAVHRLAFKGPRDPRSAYKSRVELEFDVGDPQLARQFLETLGFHVTLAFEKKRTLYRLRECTVCLDEVPVLGQFVEIEGPAEAAVTEVRRLLGLVDAPLTAESYAVLLDECLARSSQTGRREWFF